MSPTIKISALPPRSRVSSSPVVVLSALHVGAVNRPCHEGRPLDRDPPAGMGRQFQPGHRDSPGYPCPEIGYQVDNGVPSPASLPVPVSRNDYKPIKCARAPCLQNQAVIPARTSCERPARRGGAGHSFVVVLALFFFSLFPSFVLSFSFSPFPCGLFCAASVPLSVERFSGGG